MATPFFNLQNFFNTIFADNIGSIRIPTVDANGNAIDVSAGYTLAQVNARPQGNANPNYAGQAGLNITTLFNVAFDATGLTLSWEPADANTLVSQLPGATNSVGVSISNDAGVTRQLCALGQLSVSMDSKVG